MDHKPTDLREEIFRAVEQSVIERIRKGDWMHFDYHSRITVAPPELREVYESVDMAKVANLVKARLETHIADKFFHAMTTEISTDIKQILSNKELREDLRAVFRQKIREVADATSEETDES